MENYKSTIIYTTGAPGSGKTYSRCARFLVDIFLPEKSGVHYSNFPIEEKHFDELQARYPDIDVRSRVKIIPKDVLETWMCFDAPADSGPWDYFKDIDLQDAHLAIDECHYYLPKDGKGSQINASKWMKWLSTIRHKDCSVEFLTQDPAKVAKAIEVHAGVRLDIVNSEDRRDPFFGIRCECWYELRAAFITGKYTTSSWQEESRRVFGKWRVDPAATLKFQLLPEYFKYYNSYNTPEDEKNAGAKKEKRREFQKRGKLNLLWWAARRNIFGILWRLMVGAILIWIMFFGGNRQIMDGYMDFFKNGVFFMTKPKKLDEKKEEKKIDAISVQKMPVSPLRGAAKPFDASKLQNKSEEKRLKLAGVFQTSAIFSDGSTMELGDVLLGWELVAIDFKKRAAILQKGAKYERVNVGVNAGDGVPVRLHSSINVSKTRQ